MRTAAPLDTGLKNRCHPALRLAAPQRSRCGVMESKSMKTLNRPVADRQRGSKRRGRKSWLRWLCNPLVLKALIALAKLFAEVVQLFQKQ